MKNKSNFNIIVAGDGWGAVAAIKSIKNYYNCFILSNDEDVIQLVDSYRKISRFDEINYDLVVCAGYKPVIPAFEAESGKFINIHYSLLPEYRGLHSTVWAIINNEPYLGLTVHLINQYIDDGDIIVQYRIKNDYISTSAFYMTLFNKYIEDNLFTIIDDFIDGKITTIKQDKQNASWVGKRTLKDCQIDFNKPISYQKAFFRALVTPYPKPYFVLKGEKYEVISVGFQSKKIDTHIGRILNIDNEGIWVKILDGYIIFKSLIDSNGIEINNEFFKVGSFLK